MITPKIDQNQIANKKRILEQRLNELNQFKIDLGLDRLNQVLDRLNLAEISQQVIVVGGTNGKGSTVAALCSLLKIKSKSFGAFTSPHIFNFNERININGHEASDDEILRSFDAIDAVSEDIKLSYFEYAFLSAMLIFIKHKVEVVVLEVGLGGRLDATNSIDADAAIITTVDIDHIEWLGSDVESIATEKAGIMRKMKPVVYGDLNVPQAIKEQAESLGAQLIQLGQNYHIGIGENDFCYKGKSHQFEQLNKPVIQGDWQIKNFSAAFTALLEMGYTFSKEEVQQSLSEVQIKGRLQIMQQRPQVLADVAHNKQATQNLAQWLNTNPIEGQTYAVFSVLSDKQPETWLGALNEEISHWFIFALSVERAMEINSLKAVMADHVSLFSQFESAHTAYQMALLSANPEDRIVVFGSFHVLEEIFK